MSRPSYVVVFECPDAIVDTGAKRFVLRRGLYAYVGSCGASCVKRITRHLRRPLKRHWHVDFLPCAPLLAVVFRLDEKELAQRLSARLEYVPRFGSSDDPRALSHLFRVQSLRELLDVISTPSVHYSR